MHICIIWCLDKGIILWIYEPVGACSSAPWFVLVANVFAASFIAVN